MNKVQEKFPSEHISSSDTKNDSSTTAHREVVKKKSAEH